MEASSTYALTSFVSNMSSLQSTMLSFTWQPSRIQQMQKPNEYVSSDYGLTVIELFNLQFSLIYEENVLSIFEIPLLLQTNFYIFISVFYLVHVQIETCIYVFSVLPRSR